MNDFDDVPETQEHKWLSRTHTVSDAAGTLMVTCDRDRRIIELGIGEDARRHGDYELQSKLLSLMQLAWEKAGAGLNRELAERNPGTAVGGLLAGYAPTEQEYAEMEQRVLAEQESR